MTSPRLITLPLAVALLLLIAGPSAAQTICTRAELNRLRFDMAVKVRTTPRLGALWLRAGFHDCITATRAKADSGCNGSLRFETGEPDNARLQPAVDALEPFVTGTCLNWADGFMLAVEATMLATGGPSPRLVIRRRPRTEATAADTVSGNIPSVVDSYDALKEHYRARGLSERDLVVSNVGGHALGGFVPPGGSTVLPFTTTPDSFDALYAGNLADRIRERKTQNRPGFNTLPSDDQMITKRRGQRLIAIYAAVPSIFERHFRSFLRRMSRINSGSVRV